MKQKKFKDNLDRLQEVVTLLENEQLDLEKAIQLFEEGLSLVKSCNATLEDFDAKINQLITKYEDNTNE